MTDETATDEFVLLRNGSLHQEVVVWAVFLALESLFNTRPSHLGELVAYIQAEKLTPVGSYELALQSAGWIQADGTVRQVVKDVVISAVGNQAHMYAGLTSLDDTIRMINEVPRDFV